MAAQYAFVMKNLTPEAQANTIRLSYSLPTEAQIDEGVRRLARLIGSV